MDLLRLAGKVWASSSEAYLAIRGRMRSSVARLGHKRPENPALRTDTIRLRSGAAVKTGVCQRLSKRQRLETPEQFRDLLISMARTVSVGGETRRPNPPKQFAGVQHGGAHQ